MDYESDEELQQLILARAAKEQKAAAEASAKLRASSSATTVNTTVTTTATTVSTGSNSSTTITGASGGGHEDSRPKKPRGPAPIVESYTGIRLVSRKTSSDDLERLRADRRAVGVSDLGRMDDATIESTDFVLIGVLLVKTEDRKSSTGGKYSVWTVGDLQDHSADVYLFGDAGASGHGVRVGMVVCIVGPKALDRRGTAAARHFSVYHIYQIFEIGYAADFGVCDYKARHGYSCGRAFNRSKGIFCPEHCRLEANKPRPSVTDGQPAHLFVDHGRYMGKLLAKTSGGGGDGGGAGSNDLIKKLKRQHHVLKTLHNGPSNAAIADARAKATLHITTANGSSSSSLITGGGSSHNPSVLVRRSVVAPGSGGGSSGRMQSNLVARPGTATTRPLTASSSLASRPPSTSGPASSVARASPAISSTSNNSSSRGGGGGGGGGRPTTTTSGGGAGGGNRPAAAIASSTTTAAAPPPPGGLVPLTAPTINKKDLIVPHRRTFLDEEEEARKMSGTVRKPEPSVLLTKGPDTMAMQAHLARQEARLLQAQLEAQEVRDAKNEKNKAAIARAMKAAGQRNRHPAQYHIPVAQQAGLAAVSSSTAVRRVAVPPPAPTQLLPRGTTMLGPGLLATARQQPSGGGGTQLSKEEMAELMARKSRHHDETKEDIKRKLESVLGRMEEREARVDKLKAIISTQVDAYYCEQCDAYRETWHPICGRKGHTQVKRKTTKRFFACNGCGNATYVIHLAAPATACTKCGELSWRKGSMAGNQNKEGKEGPLRLVKAISDWTRPEDSAHLYS